MSSADHEPRPTRTADDVAVVRPVPNPAVAGADAGRESYEHIHGGIENSPDGFAVLDAAWRFVYLNPKADELLRPLSRIDEPLRGRCIWDALAGLRGTPFEGACRRAVEGATTVDLEYFHPAPARWFEIRAHPSLGGIAVHLRDVTRRRDAEDLLACEKNVLQKIATGAQVEDVLDTLARDIESLSVDGMLCSVLRLDSEGKRLLHGAAPHLPEAYNRAIDGVRIGPSVGSCGTAAYERVPVDVTDIATDPRWADFRALAAAHGLAACCSTPVFGSQGDVLGTIAMYYPVPTEPTARDRQLIAAATRLASIVLERVQSEEALHKSERFSRSIIDSSQDCIKTLALDGTLLWINDHGRRVLGVSDRHDVAGRAWIGLWEGEDRERAKEAVALAARGGSTSFLGRFPAEGCVRHWSVVVSPIVDAAGIPVQILAISRDVTDRVAAEQQLRGREAELRALADSIPQLAWMARPDGEIFWYNRQWYEYTGTTLESMQGWGWQAVHDPAVLPEVLRRWRESIATGTAFEMEFPLRGADGTFRTFLTRVNPVRDAEGHVVRWFGTNTDVEQVRRVRDALREETRVLEVLNRTGTTLASNLDLEALVQAITDAATELSGARFGAFFYNTTDEHGGAFMLYTLSGAPREAFARFGQPRATSLFGPTFRAEGIIRCDDVLADPRYGRMAPHHGMPAGHLPVRSYLAVPVVARSGEALGGLFFGHPDVGVFNERAERLVAAVAGQAAVAIDNARLYQAAQRAAEERDRLLASERWARAEAERSSRMKDEFLATLSHELRTPLSSILGWAQVLRTGRTTEADLRSGLDAIERNARAQTQLIEDLLDMSRIVSGKVRLDVQQVQPATFIEAAIETLRPAATAKEIRIERTLDSGPCTISGDPARLQQVVWNLLANAIKFTPKGGKVQVVLERVNSHAEISVADSGIGIDPGFLAHVFERFRQADASVTRRYGGLGLGLSIVKHLVELHGGSVQARSPGVGKGATFTVSLPLAALYRDDGASRRHPGPPPGASPEFHPVDLRGVRVLVVDDQADARELIARVLAECHAEVSVAPGAEDALPLVEHLRPHVIVSDIGMPDVDGYEFLRRVRALGPDRGGKAPAIALTAFARSEDRTRALRAGFLVHVAKPVQPTELVATVASVADRYAD